MNRKHFRICAVCVAAVALLFCEQFPSDMNPTLEPGDYRQQPAIGLSRDTIRVGNVAGQSPADESFDIWNSGTGGALSYAVTDTATWTEYLPSSGSSTGEHDAIVVQFSAASLPVGTYVARAVIQNVGGTASPRLLIIIADITAEPTPVLSVNRDSIATVCAVGRTPSPDSFTVRNAGSGTLTYSISDNVDWLRCDVDTGSSVSETDVIRVQYTVSGLAAGTHTGTITVASNGGSDQITVTLTVEQPQIGLSADSLVVACALPNTPAPRTLRITNTGNGTLNWTATDSSLWFSCNPASGALAAGLFTDVAISFDVSGLSAGTHSKVITVAGGTNPQEKTVSVTLLATATVPPSVGLDQTAFSLSCVQGEGLSPGLFNVYNAGGATLDFAVSDDAGWITCAPQSGSSSGPTDIKAVTVTYTADVMTMMVGTHTAHIVVAGQADSDTVTVTLEITGTAQFSASLKGRKFAFTAGYNDKDDDTTTTPHSLRWLGRDPWFGRGYYGDIMLDNGTGALNSGDSVLVAYALSNQQRAQFSYTDNQVSPFWNSTWGGRDYIIMAPPAYCYPDRCGFSGPTDAQLTVKAAGDSSGLYLYVEVKDDAWMNRTDDLEWKADAVVLYLDKLSSAAIDTCTACLAGVYETELTLSTSQFEVWMTAGGVPDRAKFSCYDTTSYAWLGAVQTWTALESKHGIAFESILVDVSTKVIEAFIPWAYVEGRGARQY